MRQLEVKSNERSRKNEVNPGAPQAGLQTSSTPKGSVEPAARFPWWLIRRQVTIGVTLGIPMTVIIQELKPLPANAIHLMVLQLKKEYSVQHAGRGPAAIKTLHLRLLTAARERD